MRWMRLENTQKIADRCHVEIEFGVTKLPKYRCAGWLYILGISDTNCAMRDLMSGIHPNG